MKVLLIASLALAPLAGFGSLGVDPQSDAEKAWHAGHAGLGVDPQSDAEKAWHAGHASLGHEPAPRQSAQSFELELTALGLGPAGTLEVGDADCVVLRAEGGASVLSGSVTLVDADEIGPSRLELQAVAPRVGRESLAGRAPLRMELRAFDLAHRDEVALVGVELEEGATAVAVGKRVTVTVALEHVGAPLMMSVGACED